MPQDRPPVVFTADEYRILKLLADLSNLSVGDFVRRLVAQEAARRGLCFTTQAEQETRDDEA